MKQKNKKRIRVIAVLLTLCMTFSVFSGTIVTAAETQHTSEQVAENAYDSDEPKVNTKGDLTAEELKTAKLDESDIPEVVSDESVKNNKHVNRLYEQEEDLYTVLFQNEDGTKTMYNYANPVKYVDKDGKVKDKSNKLTEKIKKNKYTKDYAYVNEENDVNTYFPKEINDEQGIVIEKDGISIEMSPVSVAQQEADENAILEDEAVETTVAESIETEEIKEVSNSAEQISNQKAQSKKTKGASVIEKSKKQSKKLKEKKAQKAEVKKKSKKSETGKNEDIITYDEVFGDETNVEYQATFEGVKENIVLETNTGADKFTFNIDAGNLEALEENGAIYFMDPLTGETKAEIAPVYTYDSKLDENGNAAPNGSTEGGYEIYKNEDGTYKVILNADTEFLNDEIFCSEDLEIEK